MKIAHADPSRPMLRIFKRGSDSHSILPKLALTITSDSSIREFSMDSLSGKIYKPTLRLLNKDFIEEGLITDILDQRGNDKYLLCLENSALCWYNVGKRINEIMKIIDLENPPIYSIAKDHIRGVVWCAGAAGLVGYGDKMKVLKEFFYPKDTDISSISIR